MTAPHFKSCRIRSIAIAMAFVGLTILRRDVEAQAIPDSASCRAQAGAEAIPGLFARWIDEVWHQGRLDLVPALIGTAYIRHEGNETRTVTPAQYAEEIAATRRRLPDVRFIIHDCDAVGDRLWTRWTMVGKSAQSGQVVHRMGAQLYRIADRRLVETWMVMLPTDASWPDHDDSRTRGFAQAPIPMHEEPRHQLVLTHHQVRVMDVKIRSGDTTLFHVHDVPALYVAVSAAPVDIQLLKGKWGGTHPAADPGRKPGDVNVDTSYVRQPITHRVTNVGTQLFNLIAITSSTVSPADSGTPEIPGDLEVQNRWFTQSRARIAASSTVRWYSTSSPTIVVQPLPGSATVLLESGEKHALNTPGSWALVPAGRRYQLRSPSSATLVVVQVR